MNKFKNLSVSWKLGSVILAFAVLSIINFGLIKYFLYIQQQDTTVVNVAAGNKLRSQQITYLTEKVVSAAVDANHQEGKDQLQESVNLYEATMNTLKNGGILPASEIEIPAAKPSVKAAIEESEAIWKKYKRSADFIVNNPIYTDSTFSGVEIDESGMMVSADKIIKIKNPEVQEAAKVIALNSPMLLESNTQIIDRFLAESEKKQSNFQASVLLILIVNIGLIAFAFFIIKRFILKPVDIIKDASRELSIGKLDIQVDYDCNDEFGDAISNMRETTRRLEGAAEFAQNVGDGKFDYEFSSSGESDSLAIALLQMRDQLVAVAEEDKKRNWATEGIAKFSDILRQDSGNFADLGQLVISSLIKYVKANQGAIFIINEVDDSQPFMELIAMHAWDRKKYLTKKFYMGEGLLGQAWQERDMLYLTEIPEDHVEITSGLGKSNPRSLVIVPLKINEEILGIIEIAAFQQYQEYELSFLEKVGESIASTLKTAKTTHTTNSLLEQSQQQSEEMKAQEEEMRQNMEELQATQEELNRKEKEYLQMIDDLKTEVDQLKEDKDNVEN